MSKERCRLCFHSNKHSPLFQFCDCKNVKEHEDCIIKTLLTSSSNTEVCSICTASYSLSYKLNIVSLICYTYKSVIVPFIIIFTLVALFYCLNNTTYDESYCNVYNEAISWILLASLTVRVAYLDASLCDIKVQKRAAILCILSYSFIIIFMRIGIFLLFLITRNCALCAFLNNPVHLIFYFVRYSLRKIHLHVYDIRVEPKEK